MDRLVLTSYLTSFSKATSIRVLLSKVMCCLDISLYNLARNCEKIWGIYVVIRALGESPGGAFAWLSDKDAAIKSEVMERAGSNVPWRPGCQRAAGTSH